MKNETRTFHGDCLKILPKIPKVTCIYERIKRHCTLIEQSMGYC